MENSARHRYLRPDGISVGATREFAGTREEHLETMQSGGVCVGLGEVARHGRPEIFNTDQGTQDSHIGFQSLL